MPNQLNKLLSFPNLFTFAEKIGWFAKTIADFDANIANLALTQRDQDFCDLTLDIEVRDVQHAEQLVKALQGSSVVSAASRQLTGEASLSRD